MNLDQLSIRPVDQADLPALEWEGEYLHFRRLYSEIYASACQGKALMLAAELPGEGIIGQLFIQLNSARKELADGVDRAYIYGFRIKPAFRRQGIGRQMMAFVENELRRRRFLRVTLNVAQDNPDAHRLYKNLGYVTVGVDPGRWSYLDHHGNQHEVNEPAWRMEKLLQPVGESVKN